MKMVFKFSNLILSNLTLIKYKIKYGKNFIFHFSDRVAPNIKIRIEGGGKVILGEDVFIRDNVILNCTGGIIDINDRVFMNDFVCVNSRQQIIIGSDTIIGQGAKFYDHDHDYKASMRKDFICANISIGMNTWIGADVIVLRGSTIGNNCVIGAATLVKGDIATGVMFLNERKEKTMQIIK